MGTSDFGQFWSYELSYCSKKPSGSRYPNLILLQIIRGTFWYQNFFSRSNGSPAIASDVLKNPLAERGHFSSRTTHMTP